MQVHVCKGHCMWKGRFMLACCDLNNHSAITAIYIFLIFRAHHLTLCTMTQALQVHWCVQAVFYLFAVNYSYLISHRSPVLVPLGQNVFKHHPERLSVVLQCVTFDPSFRGQQVPIRFQFLNLEQIMKRILAMRC